MLSPVRSLGFTLFSIGDISKIAMNGRTDWIKKLSVGMKVLGVMKEEDNSASGVFDKYILGGWREECPLRIFSTR